ncbi:MULTISPECIES: Fis family transcriptional regulator [Cupriavidus]|uniref:Putative Fis-like DNA-binding protein n=2 Tax=Cupriavidus basilensis TaxID=68895 RepID=A0A0C4Y530_9BURK|nr:MULTISPECIES: Fis family transcriptional regulator [Cupriavidus]KJK23903.1 Fis family transcriptional regulator [Burkholderiaceae bacterium 16]AJG17973.1 DNA-binding protein Fis [Cupriavidus basilensis]EHP44411.1 DNA-binding protein Fis [Cupriavidus basilensis OR16]KDP85900.1 Fis family transcriptional regulator [Cupriavidus sp. SK-3]MBB1633193.1 Fis family transcriptional regulator [Cupriavidus sp. UME77]
MSRNAIDQCIRDSLGAYFRDLDGEEPSNMYNMVLEAVERPLLEAVMARAERNQSLAAAYLGINRNTLRKKLQQHGLL